MNIEQLERAIRLWKQSFAIRRLLPQSLKASEDVHSVGVWLERHGALLPVELRPAQNEIPALARMLTSFASTSFNERAHLLRAPSGAKRAKAKARSSAEVLKGFVLEELAAEHGLALPSEIQERLIGICPPELTLVAYAKELVRRTEYASQGPSVYWLWLELNERSRNDLTVEAIRLAEQRLLGWMKQQIATAAKADDSALASVWD